MGLDRNKAVELITSYYPSSGQFGQGQIGFDHICKDYGNAGTTCAFQTHWALWRLGCTDATLVNRYEPDTSFRFVTGQNISRIHASSAFVSLDFPANRKQFLEGTIRPKPGDTIFITGGYNKEKNRYDEHVYMVIGAPSGSAKDKIEWPVSNAGAGDVGAQKGYIIPARGARLSGSEWKDTLDGRRIGGWLDIDKLPAGTLPRATQWDALAAHSLESNAGPPLPDTVIGTWKITTPYRVSYYMFYKGHRVFRVQSDNLGGITDAGFWFPRSGAITILWESFLKDVITMNGNTGSGSDDFGSYTAEKTLTTLQTMGKFSNSRGEPVNPKVMQASRAAAH